MTAGARSSGYRDRGRHLLRILPRHRRIADSHSQAAQHRQRPASLSSPRAGTSAGHDADGAFLTDERVGSAFRCPPPTITRLGGPWAYALHAIEVVRLRG